MTKEEAEEAKILLGKDPLSVNRKKNLLLKSFTFHKSLPGKILKY
jgi:hypothetical protein